MDNPLFFVHIPKTAGTSARHALVSFFGKGNVWADYGQGSPETTQAVTGAIYQQEDNYSLIQQMEKQQAQAFTGHVTMAKYKHLFPVHRCFSFVRDPLQRMFSEYQHFCRHKGFKGTFHDFMSSKPAKCNIFSRYLDGVPLGAMGMIGLTEDYAQSLTMINHTYGLKLKEKNLNQAPGGPSQIEAITDEDRATFNRLAKKDLALYANIKAGYQQRRDLFQAGKSFTHGEYQIDARNVLHGFAFCLEEPGQPVSVDIKVKDKHVATLEAKDIHPKIRQFQGPRGGFVGFKLKLGKTNPEDVSVIVKQTGQELPEAG